MTNLGEGSNPTVIKHLYGSSPFQRAAPVCAKIPHNIGDFLYPHRKMASRRTRFTTEEVIVFLKDDD